MTFSLKIALFCGILLVFSACKSPTDVDTERIIIGATNTKVPMKITSFQMMEYYNISIENEWTHASANSLKIIVDTATRPFTIHMDFDQKRGDTPSYIGLSAWISHAKAKIDSLPLVNPLMLYGNPMNQSENVGSMVNYMILASSQPISYSSSPIFFDMDALSKNKSWMKMELTPAEANSGKSYTVSGAIYFSCTNYASKNATSTLEVRFTGEM